MNRIARYASLVKFAHTVFALPFALLGYTYALLSTGTPFEGRVLVKILFCMVLARNSAMGFNRWADRKIDALNARTAGREIPAGIISPRAALWFVAVNAVLFLAVAATINRLTLLLAPVALAVLLGYSYTKRFTSLAHLVLGLSLAIAPSGAYIAVTGTLTWAPAVLSLLVMTWCGGFDIIYALQDREFDRSHGLHSVPARFSPAGALTVSCVLHALSVAATVLFGALYPSGGLYMAGALLFSGIVIAEHLLVTPTRTANIGIAFGTLNGIASLVFAAFAVADLLTVYGIF